MYLKFMRLKNFKCFADSGQIEFSQGFNVVVGKNSAGKSSLLKSLRDQRLSVPNLFNSKGKSESLVSELEWALCVSDHDIEMLFEMHFVTILIPNQLRDSQSEFADMSRKWMESSDRVINIKRSFVANAPDQFLQPFRRDPQPSSGVAARYDKEKRRIARDNTARPQDAQIRVANFHDYFLNKWRSQLYLFESQRFEIGRSSVQEDLSLQSNASNLPGAIHQLQSSNPTLFQQYINAVTLVLPEITYITTPVMQNYQCSIMLWNRPVEEARDDLAISLSESGTGVSQVLAILFIAVVYKTPSTICIDEPQSFLHPGAASKLIELLSTRYSHHQYIVATHSPTIINAANTQSIIQLTWDKGASTAAVIPTRDRRSIEGCFRDLGVRLSDVFGADHILWVEGPTEEAAFPLIFRHMKRPLLGVNIVAVSETGGFEARDPKKAKSLFDLYSKVSTSTALLPPAIGFIFDTENRSESDLQEMRRRAKDRVFFLPQSMYEDYLFDPESILTYTSALDNFYSSNSPPTSAYISSKILEISELAECQFKSAPRKGQRHAAKVFERLFSDLSETRYSYEKTTHSVELTREILASNPGHLTELIEWLGSVLDELKIDKK